MDGISTAYQNAAMRRQVSLLQAQLGKLEIQASSGHKGQTYGDLGADAPRALSLAQGIESIDAYASTIKILQARAQATDTALTTIRDGAQGALTTAIQAAGTQSPASDLRRAAQAAIAQIQSALGVSVDGRHLLSGDTIDRSPVADPTALQGLVSTAVSGAVTTPVPDAATAIMDGVAAVFSTTSNWYAGGAGIAATRISDDERVAYGQTADDPGIRQTLEGLYALANMPDRAPLGASPVPAGQLSDADWRAAVQAAVGRLTQGVAGVDGMTSRNGVVLARLDAASTEQENARTMLATQFNDIVEADPAEVATRISQIQTQIQSSFALIAQLKDLSLVNFLR